MKNNLFLPKCLSSSEQFHMILRYVEVAPEVALLLTLPPLGRSCFAVFSNALAWLRQPRPAVARNISCSHLH